MDSESNPPGTVGDVLGTAGVPWTITYLERTHPVAPATLRVLDHVEKLIAQRAIAAVAAMGEYLSPAEHQYERDALSELLRTRQHATLGKLWNAEFKTGEGLLLIYWCCIAEARETAANKASLPPPIPLEKMAKVLRESPDADAVFPLVVPSFFDAVGSRKDLPAAQTERMKASIQAAIQTALAKAQAAQAV